MRYEQQQVIRLHKKNSFTLIFVTNCLFYSQQNHFRVVVNLNTQIDFTLHVAQLT